MFPSTRPPSICLLFYAIFIASAQPARAFATEPFPSTVIRHKDGKWQLQSGYLGGAAIFVVEKDKSTLLQIHDLLPEDEYSKYVHETTAGPLWAENALSCLVSLNGKPHLCVRTWWDRRILIDLEAAKQVPDRPFDKELTVVERQHALELLKSGVGLMARKEGRTLDKIEAVHAAVDFAGRAQLKEAVPHLKELESTDYISSCSSGGWFEFAKLAGEDINPASYCLYGTRRAAQRSLRRLGEKTAGYPALVFSDENRREIEPRKRPGPRHEAVANIDIGMKPVDVLNLIGPPDYVERGKGLPSYLWRYDMDAAEPYSLFVLWNEKPTVRSLEKIEPALWSGNSLIDPTVKDAVFGADGSIVWAYANTLYSDAFKGKITKLKPKNK